MSPSADGEPDDDPASISEGPDEVREVFRGRYAHVVVESWPGREYEYVRRVGPARAGAVAIVPITREGVVLLVRQFREPIRRRLLEIPAGLRDVEGEPPEACAERELLEETGHRADAIERLGEFYSSAGLTDERYILYLAGARAAASTAPEAGIEVVRLPLTAALDAVRTGQIEDAKSALGLLLANGRG